RHVIHHGSEHSAQRKIRNIFVEGDCSNIKQSFSDLVFCNERRTIIASKQWLGISHCSFRERKTAGAFRKCNVLSEVLKDIFEKGIVSIHACHLLWCIYERGNQICIYSREK